MYPMTTTAPIFPLFQGNVIVSLTAETRLGTRDIPPHFPESLPLFLTRIRQQVQPSAPSRITDATSSRPWCCFQKVFHSYTLHHDLIVAIDKRRRSCVRNVSPVILYDTLLCLQRLLAAPLLFSNKLSTSLSTVGQPLL
jgi:hypothetical protein